MQKYLSELSRSRPYREAPDNFSELVSVLIRSAERERAGLKRAIEGLLKTAEVIPLDTDMLYRAGSVQFALDMSAQDSIVLASVIHHLQETDPPESCFLNRNTKDFDDPNVRELLEDVRCKFFGRFDDGLRYIEARLRAEEP